MGKPIIPKLLTEVPGQRNANVFQQDKFHDPPNQLENIVNKSLTIVFTSSFTTLEYHKNIPKMDWNYTTKT